MIFVNSIPSLCPVEVDEHWNILEGLLGDLKVTDRSATSFASSGWLLPVSNLIELVAMTGVGVFKVEDSLQGLRRIFC